MEIKAVNISAFLNSPPNNLRVILIYGPDRGLVAERTRHLVKHYAGSLDDAFNISRMNSSDITSDTNPLFDEYLSIPMFGGQKVLWIFDDAAQIHKQITAILNEKQDGNLIIIEGRDLKKTSALVKLCLKHKQAVSLACYQDTTRDLSQLIRDVMAENNLKISTENVIYLQSLLGSDRQLSRSELNKLALYCYDQGEVTAEHIHQSLSTDAAKFSFDKLIDAIAGGQSQIADKELSQALAIGNHPIMIFAILRNHFNMLHKASHARAAGKSPEAILQTLRPPVFYSRKPAITNQINRWNTNKTNQALLLIADADINTRQNAPLAPTTLNRLITRLSLMVK